MVPSRKIPRWNLGRPASNPGCARAHSSVGRNGLEGRREKPAYCTLQELPISVLHFAESGAHTEHSKSAGATTGAPSLHESPRFHERPPSLCSPNSRAHGPGSTRGWESRGRLSLAWALQGPLTGADSALTRGLPVTNRRHTSSRSPSKRRSQAWLCLSGLVALGLLACQRPQAPWTPVLEETSTRFLETETGRALESIEQAQGVLAQDAASARRHLDTARSSLLRLRDYYLPLLKARGSAYNAYRWLHMGDERRVLRELATIESLLLKINQRGHPHISRELEPVLEIVVKTEAAVTAGRGDAAELIETLASHINMLQLKGDLALHGSELGEE